VYGQPFTLDPPTEAAQLPSEVAMCVTIIGQGRDQVSPEVADNLDPSGVDDADIARDRPMQRRTGRIYVGDFSIGAVGSDGRPTSALRSRLLAGAAALDAELELVGCSLAVWSRKNATMYEAVGAFVDDAFDTQRRRGLAPLVRTQQAL
jgi:hypothetical protein